MVLSNAKAPDLLTSVLMFFPLMFARVHSEKTRDHIRREKNPYKKIQPYKTVEMN